MRNFTALFSLIIFSYLPSQGQGMTYGSTVDIGSQTTISTITKEHDVIVTYDDHKYVIQFNIKHGKKIQTHRASVSLDKHFDKASYSWVSKNKVAIKLFSLDSSDKYELKVWGENKGSTGMEVDIEEDTKS